MVSGLALDLLRLSSAPRASMRNHANTVVSPFVPTPPSPVAYGISHTSSYWHLFFPCHIPHGTTSLHTNKHPHPQARHNQPYRLRTPLLRLRSRSRTRFRYRPNTLLLDTPRYQSHYRRVPSAFIVCAFPLITPVLPPVVRPRLLLQ